MSLHHIQDPNSQKTFSQTIEELRLNLNELLQSDITVAKNVCSVLVRIFNCIPPQQRGAGKKALLNAVEFLQ